VFQTIVLFNANQHAEAILRVQELAVAGPSADILACRVVEVSIKHTIKPWLMHRLISWTSHIRLIYVSNWESMSLMMRVTMKSTTSLPLSTVAFSHRNRQSILNTRSLSWYVDDIS
jgi:hypothetical protein